MAISSVGAAHPAPKPAQTANHPHPAPSTPFKSLSSKDQQKHSLVGSGHHVNKLV
jgi:hypothetical protein